MKRITAIIISLFFVFIMGLLSGAAVYVDELDKLESGAVINYENLKKNDITGELQFLQDKSVMVMADPQRAKSSLTYRVSGAKAVAVNTYNPTGTDIYRNSKNVFTLNSEHGAQQTNITPKYSPLTGRVYILNGPTPEYLVYDSSIDAAERYIFKPTAEYPNDLLTYGVTIYSSIDGITFNRINQKKLQSIFYATSQMNLETWSAHIPSNAKYIKIEVNDTPMLEDYGGNNHHFKVSNTMTMLARVEISGDNMVFGAEAEPVIKENIEVKAPIILQSTEYKSAAKSQNTPKPIITIEPKVATKVAETQDIAPKPNAEQPATPIETQSSSKPATVKKELPTIIEEQGTLQIEHELEIEQEQVNDQQFYYVEEQVEDKGKFPKIVIAYVVVIISILGIIIIRSGFSAKKQEDLL